MRPAFSRKYRLDPKGFTLIELIVAMTIFGIIGSVLITIFVAGLTYFSEEKSQLINQGNISVISGALEADTRKSSSMTITGSCLVLTQSASNSTYCLNATTHEFTRNSTVIADNIATVTYTIDLNKLTLNILTIADRRGVQNKITMTYYLREGNY
jgi:prepilin-type N-terminal cleavage/methylation domain-containing protein